MSGRGDPVRLHRARATRLQAPQSIAGLPTTRARGLPKRVPKLRSSESTEENSEHLAELKTPGNNSYDLKSTRCKAVYTGSIPVVAFIFARKRRGSSSAASQLKNQVWRRG